MLFYTVKELVLGHIVVSFIKYNIYIGNTQTKTKTIKRMYEMQRCDDDNTSNVGISARCLHLTVLIVMNK